MSVSDLARAAGLAPATLYRWEKAVEPKLSNYIAVERAVAAREKELLDELLAIAEADQGGATP